MLVLNRTWNEETVITCPDGTCIRVTVVYVRGDKVGLGFDAPEDYRVNRREVQDAIERGER